MKTTILSLTLALSAVLSAASATQAAPELVVRDVDCNYCSGMLNFCFENGHSRGQEGCKQTCREHVCHRTPECKKCHGEFDRCPEKSRFVN